MRRLGRQQGLVVLPPYAISESKRPCTLRRSTAAPSTVRARGSRLRVKSNGRHPLQIESAAGGQADELRQNCFGRVVRIVRASSGCRTIANTMPRCGSGFQNLRPPGPLDMISVPEVSRKCPTYLGIDFLAAKKDRVGPPDGWFSEGRVYSRGGVSGSGYFGTEPERPQRDGTKIKQNRKRERGGGSPSPPTRSAACYLSLSRPGQNTWHRSLNRPSVTREGTTEPRWHLPSHISSPSRSPACYLFLSRPGQNTQHGAFYMPSVTREDISERRRQLAGWKCCSCFQDRADSAIIGAKLGRHLGNVGWYSSPAYQALVPLRDEAAEMTLIAYSVPA